MAQRVYRQKKKELGLLTEKEFFTAVAVAAGYLDEEMVRRVYRAMMDVTFTELRAKGAIRYPRLCDFHLLLSAGKRIKNYKMPVAMYKPPHHQLRIRPMYTIREYFKQVDMNSPNTVFDPVERLKAAKVAEDGGNMGHGTSLIDRLPSVRIKSS